MGRIIYDTATTFNGWIADRHQSLNWLFAVDQDGVDSEGLRPKDAKALVMGSTTYEWIVDHEDMLVQPEKWKQFHGDKPVFVFTSRQLAAPAGADVRFVSGAIADMLPMLRDAVGDGDIWVVGGGDLAGQFLDAEALDEIRLAVAPVALDGGAPLLPRNAGADRLRLVSASAHGQFARLVYSVGC